MNTHQKFLKYRLSLLPTLIAAVLLAGGITLLALWCQPNALRTVLAHFSAQPLLIVLNALPIGLLLLTCTCLLGNVFWSGALVNFAVCALSIANRIKLEVRDEPVFPRDLGLLKEVGSAMGTYDIRFPWSVIAVVIATTLALVIIGLFVGCKGVSPAAFRSRRTPDASAAAAPPSRLKSWILRLAGAAVSFGILVAAILTVYASNDLYNSFTVSNAYYIPAVFNELGFPYCFSHQFTTYPIDRPEGFDRAAAAGWETGDQPGQGKSVHLIMVMNEAFADLSDESMFNYSAEEDPLSHLHALQKQSNTISGHLVVPGFAGGTANTEFDVLTGMQTNALSTSTTSAFRVVNRNLDSVLRVFGNDDYHTSFFHPGDDWFYNRENVYRWLGAEETVFADQMEDLQYKGRWVTDDYMAQYIEDAFAAAVADGQLLCNYTTTIQNHMSYTADKYGAAYDYPAVPLTVDVSPEVETLLQVYLEGVRDADAMLGRLTDHFSASEEPVVLAFWGDHLPYLGDNQLAYAELGSEVSLKENDRSDPLLSYKTPYVIWANDAAMETLDWDETVAALDLPEDNALSASFLGALLLELTGRKEESPWFSFLNELRREAPVVQKKTVLLPDGVYSHTKDLEDQQLLSDISRWRQWSYYKLRYKDVE